MLPEMIQASFVPMLFIPSGTNHVEFYSRALHAVSLREWRNDDGTLHVSELIIGDALLHIHEESVEKGKFSPARISGVTSSIGLMVEDVDAVMQLAVKEGAKELSPAQDYDYGYRQGELEDPFGHKWIIQKRITNWLIG